MRRWSEIFIFLAFVGFITSIAAASMKSSMLLGFSVRAYGQFTICALVFSIALSLMELTKPQK
ncbi:MAG: hypothetical protein PHD29_00665 [bacterium]|nr:hypothetical protein [bacterium]